MNAKPTGVIVGVDGSPCSRAALEWAAKDAAKRGTGLTIATVVDLPRLTDVPMSSEFVTSAIRGSQQVADAAVPAARDIAPEVAVEVTTGDPAGELIQMSAHADEVVVGSRGLGGFGALVLGSVGNQVAAHAQCPVVVVRGESGTGPVVVGVDGSDRGDAALEYGFGYADRNGLPLLAVHAYTLGAFSYPDMPYPIGEELAWLRDNATCLVERRLQQWTAKYPDVAVQSRIAEGGAAHVLVEASRGASLLVVGSHGHGGFARMVLGSVSQVAIRHAYCPVAVAR